MPEEITVENNKGKLSLISASFLVLGNVLGVGVLALPVKTGLSGFVPALLGIIGIWAVMLITAWVIAYRIGNQEHFDIPSFYHQEVGQIGKWLAIACNLLLLYGVLVAYLSGMSSMIANLIPTGLPQWVLVVIYFLLTTALIMFGTKALHKGNALIIAGIWISFTVLIFTGLSHFDDHLLFHTYKWKFIPLGLPVVVSAFHFHNIIPTVCKTMKHDQKAIRKAIFLGVFMGLIINLVWVVVVLGSLPELNVGKDNILSANIHNWPANIPMSDLLKNKIFTYAGLTFAMLAVTASYIANGTGLYGFIKDLTHNYLGTSNKILVGLLSFVPPLAITLIYPDVFLKALTLVGGVGETILFVILPAFILIRLFYKKSITFTTVGAFIFILGVFITLFVLAQQFGLIKMKPEAKDFDKNAPEPQAEVSTTAKPESAPAKK
jgi:tyrosine-specific transport protein